MGPFYYNSILLAFILSVPSDIYTQSYIRYLVSATMYYRTLNLLDRGTNQLTFSMNVYYG